MKKDWFFHIEDNDNQGNKVVKISDGSQAKKLHHDMIKVWGFLDQRGHSLIIDEVIWRKEIFWWYLEEFSAITPIYLIKVKCDLVVAITREQARENRFIGLARGLKEVEKNIDFYDLEIDTTNSSLTQSAEIILNYIKENPFPVNFRKNYLANFAQN